MILEVLQKAFSKVSGKTVGIAMSKPRVTTRTSDLQKEEKNKINKFTLWYLFYFFFFCFFALCVHDIIVRIHSIQRVYKHS